MRNINHASWLHGFAFDYAYFSRLALPALPALARAERPQAPALKPTYKAGRRGGDSIAREDKNVIVVNLEIIGWFDG